MINFTNLYTQLFWNKQPFDVLMGMAISIVVFIIFKLCANFLSKHARFIAQKIFKTKEKSRKNIATCFKSKKRLFAQGDSFAFREMGYSVC